MEKNIMLLFVSPINPMYLENPIPYPDIQGCPYDAIQTNEAAVVYVERMLGAENSLSKIFLIASDFVKQKKVAPENEFGDVTHLEFLEERLTKEFPALKGKFSVQDYTEEDTGSLEKNILQTAKIADAIMEFARQNPAAKVIVHADMTGGFRHASMFMLSVMQLLKYRGIEIAEVLYSDPKRRVVYSAKEIQRMFTLITGADEFVKFGSVMALEDYFGKEPSPAVKTLLEAMKRFSEAIKICRTSVIEEELKNLGQRIQTFRENPDKDLKAELFAKIIDTIEVEYGNLLDDQSERLEIIRWCMKKGFWQQAMTLCTEWLPEEIINSKIFVPIPAVQKDIETGSHIKWKTWQQFFITDYKFAEKSPDGNDFANKLRSALETKKITGNDDFGDLKKFLAEYRDGKTLFELCQKQQLKTTAFKSEFPEFHAVLQAIYDAQRKNPNYKKNFYEFLRSLDYKKIPKFVANFSDDKIFALFKIERENTPSKISEPVEKSVNRWENRENEYRTMFAKKVAVSDFDAETALKFLRGYYDIRNERNQVNHANAKAAKSVAEIKSMIEHYLDALEKFST